MCCKPSQNCTASHKGWCGFLFLNASLSKQSTLEIVSMSWRKVLEWLDFSSISDSCFNSMQVGSCIYPTGVMYLPLHEIDFIRKLPRRCMWMHWLLLLGNIYDCRVWWGMKDLHNYSLLRNSMNWWYWVECWYCLSYSVHIIPFLSYRRSLPEPRLYP